MSEEFSWPLVRLKDVTADVPNVDPSRWPDQPFTYVDISAIDNGRCVITSPKRLLGKQAPSRARRPIREGDVLFSNVRTYLRNVAQVDGIEEPSVASTGFTVLRPNGKLASRFLYHLARSDYFIDQVTPEQTGTHYPATSDRVVRDQLIPLPPLETQERLSDLIDGVERARQSAQDHLGAAHSALGRFRQAVLAAAFFGRLTADWREAHDVEGPGFRSTAATGRSVPSEDMYEELPETWRIATLSDVILRVEAGKSFAALGRPATDDEWGVVKVSAMSWGDFLEQENKAVPEGRQINPSYEIRSGDLLLSRANTADLVGATVLVDRTRPNLLLSDKSLRLVPREAISKRWLLYILRAPMVRAQFAERATGTSDSMRNLSQEKILATIIPLPSPDEQEEIARRVHDLFTVAATVEKQIKKAGDRIAQTSQAILAEAFRGNLVEGAE